MLYQLSYSPKNFVYLAAILCRYSSAVQTEADVYPNCKLLASTCCYKPRDLGDRQRPRLTAMIFGVRFVLVVVVMAGCWHDSTPDPVVPPIVINPKPAIPHVAAAEFGVFVDGQAFVKSPTIKLAAGVAYGWRIRLPCREMVDFRETLKMPSPGDWHVNAKTKISADRTQVVTEDALACFNGWVEHVWVATEGDPEGVYTITVEIDGYAPVRFHPRFAR